MDTVYLILYVVAAVCFTAVAFFASTPMPVALGRVNLLAVGLLAWVLVPMIVLIDRMNND